MEQTTTTKNAASATEGQNANGVYRVSANTAAILDCMRAADRLFEDISDYLSVAHGSGIVAGVDVLDEACKPYHEHLQAVTELLNCELLTQVADRLSDTKNISGSCIEV